MLYPKGPYLSLETEENKIFALCSPTPYSGGLKVGIFMYQSCNGSQERYNKA